MASLLRAQSRTASLRPFATSSLNGLNFLIASPFSPFSLAALSRPRIGSCVCVIPAAKCARRAGPGPRTLPRAAGRGASPNSRAASGRRRRSAPHTQRVPGRGRGRREAGRAALPLLGPQSRPYGALNGLSCQPGGRARRTGRVGRSRRVRLGCALHRAASVTVAVRPLRVTTHHRVAFVGGRCMTRYP